MSTSRCILMVGTGSHFHGDGIAVDVMMPFYDDKGVWRFVSLKGEGCSVPRWFTTPERMFDDAFLMISLYLLGDLPDSGLPDLVGEAKAAFKVDLYKPKDGFIETYRKNRIAPEAREKLYARNRELLGDTNVKVVPVFLGSNAVLVGGVDPDRETFLRAVEAHRLQNTEVCVSTFARYYGAFDA